MSRKAPLLATVAAGLALATAGPAEAATDAEIAAAVTNGAAWIETQQDATDGTFNAGFSGFDPTAAPLASSGRHAADVRNGASPSLQDALVTGMANLSAPGPATVGSYEIAILSAAAAGIDPARALASKNLVADLASLYSGGYFGDPAGFSGFNHVAFGTLALNRSRAPRFLLDRAIAVMRANQHDDGGWDFPQSTPDTQDDASNVDLTGATLAALCDSGVPAADNAVKRGMAFLRSRYVPSSGAIVGPPAAFGSANASSTGWAVSGLKACGVDPQGTGFDSGPTPVDYLLSLQDTAAGPDHGSFEYAIPQLPGVPAGPNLPASRDALQALAGRSFSADPPQRSAGLPRRRPVTPPADGTPVPVALAVDDGAGRVTFCRVIVPNGTSLAELLATASGSSAPGSCATGAEFTGGRLSKLNGQSGTWVFSVDDGGETTAASQTVRFGDLVGLRRADGDTPATPGSSGGSSGGSAPAPVPAAQQARTTPTGVASKSLRASRRKRVVTVSLRCAKDNRLCQGVVYLVYKKRTLARRPFLIGGGKTTRLNVKLSKRAMKRLGKSKKRIKVNTFSRDGAGVASTSSRTISLTTTK